MGNRRELDNPRRSRARTMWPITSLAAERTACIEDTVNRMREVKAGSKSDRRLQ